jgi:phage shock protein A
VDGPVEIRVLCRMFGKLKAKLEGLLSALEDRTGSDPGEDITRLLAGMREELIDAKASLPGLEKQIVALGRLAEKERERAEDAARRGGQAAAIGDVETVEVAARFEAKHRERANVYSQKQDAARAELALQRRAVSEMTSQFKSAMNRREALVAQARRAKTTENLRGGAASPLDEFDRMAREIEDEELQASANLDVEDALEGLDPEFEPDPEKLAELQLEELKRRMSDDDES